MTREVLLPSLAFFLMLCGIGFWGSLLFSSQTRLRISEGWRWLSWRPLPHDMGRALFMAFAVSFLLQMLAVPLFQLVQRWPGSFQVALMLLVYQGVIVVVIFLHLRRLRISERDAFGMGRGGTLHDLVWGFAGYCMVILPVVISTVMSRGLFWMMDWEFAPQSMVQMLSGETSWLNSLLLLFLVGGVAPFLEEVIFRGVLFPLLVERCGAVPGLLLQGLIFSVVHLHPGSALPLFVLGVILGLLYVHTRRLMVCVWMHAWFNSVTLILNLPVFSEAFGG